MAERLKAGTLDLGLMRRELRNVPTASLEARIATMLDLVDLTIDTVRRVATELRPAVLDDFGLRAALEHERAAFVQRTGIALRLEDPDEQALGLER